jgi:hypothetical protein
VQGHGVSSIPCSVSALEPTVDAPQSGHSTLHQGLSTKEKRKLEDVNIKHFARAVLRRRGISFVVLRKCGLFSHLD